MSQLFDRVFKALTDAHYIEETATPGRFVWRDEDDARRRFKRFHADPVKYAQYIDADLTGLVGGLAAESADFVKALDRVKSLETELAATRALLADESERRRMAELAIEHVRQFLPPPLELLTEAQSIRRFGVDLNGKRVIGYKEPKDRP